MRRKQAMQFCLIILLALVASSAKAQSPADEYVLQRGDDLEIRAYDLPDLNAGVRIRPDGRISLLLLNDIDAAGLTASKLNQILTERYSSHFRNPRLAVIVRSFAAQTVFVGGEVGQPAAMALPGSMTALQAVIRAGGLKDTATGDNILILRGIDKGTPVVETLNMREVMENQKPDAILNPSDVVYVPKNYVSVYVGGEVAKPGLVPLSGDLTMLAAVIQAGGFLQSAKMDGVVLVRNGGKETPVMTKVRLNDVFLSEPHTKLKPYDVVFVPKSRIARLDQWVDQHIRQLNPFTLSIGFSYLWGNKGSGTTATQQLPELFF